MGEPIYVEDKAAIEAMLGEAWLIPRMRARGDAVKDRAEQISPVQTGRYKRSWRVYSGIRNGRAWCRVANIAKDPRTGYRYPWAIEHGTSRMRRQRVLGRAVDAVLGPGTTTR